MPFVKALIQNISTDTSEDLLFSLMPSQVKSFLVAGSGLCGTHQSLPLLSQGAGRFLNWPPFSALDVLRKSPFSQRPWVLIWKMNLWHLHV